MEKHFHHYIVEANFPRLNRNGCVKRKSLKKRVCAINEEQKNSPLIVQQLRQSYLFLTGKQFEKDFHPVELFECAASGYHQSDLEKTIGFFDIVHFTSKKEQHSPEKI